MPGTKNVASFPKPVRSWTLAKNLCLALSETSTIPHCILSCPYAHREMQLPSLT